MLEQFRGSKGCVHLVEGGVATFRNFASLRGGCLCPAGSKGYYEVEVLGEELSAPQWGFCADDWGRADGYVYDGVGDDATSWGADGDHGLLWRGGEKDDYGGRWRPGDIVGLACDLSPPPPDCPPAPAGGRMLVSVNGDFAAPNGGVMELPAGLAGLFPALSATAGRVRVNLGGEGGRAFRHAPPGEGFAAMADYAVGGKGSRPTE